MNSHFPEMELENARIRKMPLTPPSQSITSKQHQQFVFTEISEIELPPEILKYSDKIRNGSIHSMYKGELSRSFESPPLIRPQKVGVFKNGRKACFLVLGILLGIGLLVAGVPIFLQLRSESLLEARLAFVKRLLTEETPLVEGYWNPALDRNFSVSISEVAENLVGALLWSIPIPCGAQYLDAVQLALEGIDESKRKAQQDHLLTIIESSDEMEKAHSQGNIAVLLGLEGGHSLGASLAVLRSMYLLGARFVSVTGFGCTTPWAESSPKAEVNHNELPGLTEFGEIVLMEMNRIGIMVEISRMSERGMILTLQKAKAPVLLSNAAPASFCNSTSTASIPDHILGMMAQNGGVLMLNVDKCGSRTLTLKESISMINYVRTVAGVDHVGLSASPRSYPPILAELARDRMWGKAAIKKLIGGNLVRVLREVEVSKDRVPLSEDWIPTSAIEGNSYCRYPES